MGKSDRLSGAGVKYSNRVVRISLIGNKGVMKVKTDQAVDTQGRDVRSWCTALEGLEDGRRVLGFLVG
ncbi:hypothetical protein Pyn_21284 [Prunus yedoensis var. nudiflora]|uniref:Uncharacterized protein n=1 Tax=Prunus yedoensis var. nudiflora TaxID=2094558 RepID=A0A314XLA9_PRUYE|nr:hypothetical protein Pyn_21284 [Prunus yedoensis var. nudiflora]